jgi:hypothetical protein
MLSTSRTLQHDALALLQQYSNYIPPLLLLISSTLANVGTPPAHSLLTSAIAWTALCVVASVGLRRWRTQTGGSGSGGNARRLAWAAGGLLALGRVCEKAVDGRGIWWANVCVYLVRNALSGMLLKSCRLVGSTSSDITRLPPILNPQPERF